jgi:hypothetical protein
MRVCISYTHPYPIKSLNHTLPFRICKLSFQANMQVTSTLWHDIKSQKLSEHQFRLRWTKSDARTQFKQVKIGQPQRGSDKEAQDCPPEEVGVVGGPGRPTDLPGRLTWPMGPTASTMARGASPLVPYVGCAGYTPWLPGINTRGVENRTHIHTHHTPLTFPLLHSLHSL